ncbi:MAG: hypothetical protein DSY37_00180 [Hyperthermus sp.]|nr:MAG: hypothetical protein DSY37_00180 [Hyperthermus sp.]
MDLAALVHQAIPLATIISLTALGEVYLERAGRVNLGLEGILYIGYSASALASVYAGSLLVGLASSLVATLSMSLIFFLLVEILRVDQAIVGLALVFTGIGLGDALGVSSKGLAGPMLSHSSALLLEILALLALPVASYILLQRTWLGLVVRSAGEDEESARYMGVPLAKVRLLALIVESILVSLASLYFYAYYSSGAWRAGRPLGLGWLSLGMVILGYWNPIGVAISSLLLGVLYSLRPLMPAIGIPNQVADAVPYAVVVVALVIASWIYRRTGYRPPALVWKV